MLGLFGNVHLGRRLAIGWQRRRGRQSRDVFALLGCEPDILAGEGMLATAY